MDKLQTGIEQPFAVLFQSGEATLYHPAPGDDLEGVPFAAFGYLYRDVLAHALCKRLPTELLSASRLYTCPPPDLQQRDAPL